MNSSVPADNGETVDEDGNNVVLVVVWILAFCLFILFPFCSSKKRRQLCRQRLRERRWVTYDDDEDDWYRQAFERRRAERRQLMEEEQQRFRTTKTQEDEIREQYLLMLLEKHSLVLSTSDFSENKLIRSSSQSSTDQNSACQRGDRNQGDNITGTDMTETPSSDSSHKYDDIEAPTVSASPSQDSYDYAVSVDDDDDALKEMNFVCTNEVVYIPFPGESKGRHRQAPNGCAICLAYFVADEKISWSSNGKCLHVFHHDCLLHWFHTVGRKTRKKQLRQRAEMDDAEALDLLCKFSKLCPCCRQTFCVEYEKGGEMTDVAQNDGHQALTETTNSVMVDTVSDIEAAVAAN